MKHYFAVAVLLALVLGSAAVYKQERPAATFEECILSAARTAKSDYGAQILEKMCISQYPDSFAKQMKQLDKAVADNMGGQSQSFGDPQLQDQAFPEDMSQETDLPPELLDDANDPAGDVEDPQTPAPQDTQGGKQ